MADAGQLSPGGQRVSVSRGGYLALAALAVLACCGMDIFIYDYRHGFENHGIQIPYVLRRLDPSLYPGDRMMVAMEDYFSYFWPLVAWLASHFPLERVLLAGHVLVQLLRYSAVFAIGARAFPTHRWVPFLCLWAHLWGETVLGGESLHWYYLTHTSMATALGLWAVFLGVAGWWVAGFALAGFIFNVHAMQSAYLLMMLGVAALPELRARWPTLAVAAACYLLAASPGLAWMLRSGATGSPPGLEELIKAFYPAHFFPSAFNVYNWAGLALMVVLLAVPVALLPRTGQVVRLALMAASILVFWLVGGVLLETLAPGILIKMHIYRASSYLAALALVLMPGWVVLWLLPSLPRALRLPALACAMALAVNLGSFNFLRYEEAVIAVLGMLAVGCIIAAIWIRSLPSRRVLLSLAAIILLALGVQQQRVRFKNMHDYFWWLERWVEVQQWARENSEPADRFLTPPDMNGFRAFSQRPVVFEWFDGAAMLWDAAYAEHWRAWYLESGGKFRRRYGEPIFVRIGDTWRKKPRAEIEAIARREGARFIVMRTAHYFETSDPRAEEWKEGRLFDNGFFFATAVTPAPAGQSDLQRSSLSP